MRTGRRPLAGRLLRYVLERYSPIAYGPLVFALVLAGQGGAALAGGHSLDLTWSIVWATLAVGLGFLQLRVLDDLRDVEVDTLGRPDRPLPRGLVSRAELRSLAAGAAIVGIAVVVPLGIAALGCYGLALGQVWLLASGRPDPSSTDRRVVADAFSHSLIVPTMLAVGWASAGPLGWRPELALTLVLSWGAGLALEVSRKTVTRAEERTGVETYSGALGRPRALAMLAASLGAAAVGAALVAATAGASAAIAVLPVALVVVLIAAAVVTGGRLTTAAIRGTVPILVLGVLAWPSLLAWGLR